MLERQTTAEWANRVLNDPSVRPYVADLADGALNIEQIAANPQHVLLAGEHGVFVILGYGGGSGLYEVHSAVLASGRGRWAAEAAREVVDAMFTATDCIEILTRVPRGHIGAKALAEKTGFVHIFTTPPECKFRGETVPCHIYSLTLQEWLADAQDFDANGAQFHDWMHRTLGTKGAHPPDPAHNRTVGCCLAMAGSGQARKAVVWYNRAALISRHPTIALLNEDPPQIRFDAGILTFAPDGLRLDRAN